MKRHIIIPAALSALLILTAAWGYNQHMQRQQYRVYLENQYQKSFYELVSNVGNLETRLSKMMVSASPSQNVNMLTEIWRQSNSAQDNLGQLPISHPSLSKTAKFINQVGDFSYSMSQRAVDGKPITQKEMASIAKLHNSCADLSRELKLLETQANRGGLNWGELAQKAPGKLKKGTQDIITQRFEQIEKTSTQYPVLIYDGPFSESLEKQTPRGLGNEDISVKQAEDIALRFIGAEYISGISRASDGNGNIKTWGFEARTKDQNNPINIHITKKGGKVLWMMENAKPGQKRLTIDQCSEKAQVFLRERGFSNMAPSYKQFYDGVAVINFTAMEDDVIIYPDLIKVRVAMDTGRVVGFEAQNYIMSHAPREIPKAKISEKEARDLVNGNLEIKSVRLAIIPTEARGEKLCYEFNGTFGKEHFIVYINALTGKEENILKIIDTENGNLAL